MVNITYMKRLNKSIFLLLLLLNFNSFAQIPAVFTCDATALYQTIKITEDIDGVGEGGDMIFYRVDPTTGEFTFVSNLSVDDDGAGTEDIGINGEINSISFNPIDGLIYGINDNTDELFRITPNGFVESVGFITGPLNNSNSNEAGCFDKDGIYYLFGSSGELISVDLTSPNSLPSSINSTLLYNLGKPSADIAINPLNNLIYAWDRNNRQLYTINPSTGDVNIIGPSSGTSQYRLFGAMYFTAGGQLIAYGDDTNNGFGNFSQETLVQINTTTGVPTPIATGLSVGVNDGGSCPFGLELFKDAPQNVDLGEDFTYTFTIFNASGVPLTDLNFTDDLMDGIVFITDPYNITGGIDIIGSTNGMTSADLTINNVDIGISTFQIDVTTDCSVENMTISNQAILTSEFITVVSDDPDTAGITNTTVTDIVDPTINAPNPLIIEGCDISAFTEEAAVFPLLTDSQSEDVKDVFNTVANYTTTAPQNIESITYIDTIVDGDACPIVINREFSLTSTCGSVTVIVQEINVSDLENPVFNETNLPGNLTFECSGEAPEPVELTASDNCAEVEVVFVESITNGDCPFDQVIERTWSATDECGNTVSHTQTITTQDTIAPDAPDAPDDITIENGSIDDIPEETLTALDNCSGEIDAVSVDSVDDSNPNNIIITRTWTFIDDCGNSSEISQTITLIVGGDAFVCDGTIFYQTIRINNDIEGVGSAGDFILYLVNPNGEFSFFANLSVDDDGDGTEDEGIIDTINGIGFNTVDGLLYGVDSTQDYLYRILPNGYVQNLGIVTGAISNNSNFSGTFDNNGTYYVLGNNGNLVSILGTADLSPGDPITSTFLFDLNVNSPDIAINPSNFLMYGWDSDTRQLFTVDLDNGNVEIIGPAANTSNYFSFGGLYFTASGQLFGYGNDTNIGSPGNSQESVVQFNLETGEPTTIGIGIEVTANDGASCAFGFELLKDAPDNVDLGQTFTYTFTIANATNEVLNDLEFIDNLVPGLVFVSDPYNITNGMSIDGTTNGLNSANLTISDIALGSSTFQIDVVTDCTVEDMVISNQASLSSDFLTVTSDDPDTAGVTNTTLTEIIDPEITIPNPLEIEGCDISVVNSDNAVFAFSDTTSDDIKDVFNTVDGYTTTAPQNITSITYIDTIEDENSCPIVVNRVFTLINTCGVSTNYTQTINVQDSEAPTFTVPADITIECEDDASFLSLTGDVTDEADNCTVGNLEATFTDTAEIGECPGLMVISREWSLVDNCGNVNTQIQIITMQDSTAPTFTVPADVTLDCAADINDLSVAGDVTDEGDNCATELEATYTDDVTTGECPVSSIITRTWTLSDGCNETSLVQTITLEDNEAPTVNGDFDEQIAANCGEIPEIPALDFQDNCAAEVDVVFTETSDGEEDDSNYTITRVWTVSDGCNEVVFTQTVLVNNDLDISPIEGTSICIDEDFSFDLFDLLEGDVDEDGTWTAQDATINLEGSLFNPTQLLNGSGGADEENLGDYNFTYTYSGVCSGEITATLNINDDCIVLPCGRDDVEISRAVTVNGDTVNDFFTIKGVENCGFSYEVQIFNRWGAKIYENNSYQNDWGGQVSDGSFGGADLVPTGTYYYVLNIRNSGFEPIAGPIYVSTK